MPEVNGIGYNPIDNYLYAAQEKNVVRVSADGRVEIVAKLPFKPNMGDFDDKGVYYCSKGGRNWATIDLNPKSSTYKQVQSGESTFESEGTWTYAADWAHTPVDPDHLYGVGVRKGNGPPTLVKWSIRDKKWVKVWEARNLQHGHTFGAVMATSDGVIYGLENMSGNIVRFDLYNITRTSEVKGGPTSRSKPKRNDGTRCIRERDTERPR
ncbi:hypothetical protein CDD83_407 [Cordyceps sp. RAO-2017]|nr:hypothetical protein CDD83_407 [Cordyceps sp. RAO-2017]